MKTNWVDIITKYMTWYKDLEITIETDALKHTEPILCITDLWMGTKYRIYWVEDIIRNFKLIGLTRLSYTGKVNQ